MINDIFVASEKNEEKFLRKKTAEFKFEEFTKRDIQELVSTMKSIMRRANGIGLSANQIGLNYRMFVAEVPDAQGGQKFYAIFNPKIEKADGEKQELEEGCLSIPGKFGMVPRYERVNLSGFDRNGRPVRIKAWGLLAHVFQHETDHLEGKLVIDRTKKVFDSQAERAKR